MDPGENGLGTSTNVVYISRRRTLFLPYVQVRTSHWEGPASHPCDHRTLLLHTVPLLKASMFSPDCSLCLDSIALLHYLKQYFSLAMHIF